MQLYHLKDLFKFLFQAAVGGLALAFVALVFFPDLIPAPGKDTGGGPAAQAGGRPLSYHDAIRRASPAVVNVYTTQVVQRQVHPLFQDPLFRRFFGEPPQQEPQLNSNLGSGVILNDKGYLLTNAHVINKATEIQITLSDGRQAHAGIVGIDSETDLAVLKIDLDDLPTAPIGDSGRLDVGDVVLAIGNPYDFGQTVTQGIVSAMGRQRLGISAIEDFIQTDADINPGNSGGALIDARGRLVGINTAIFSQSGGSQGIGFAIPINLAVDVMDQIIDQGYVVRGWLGVVLQTVPQDIAESVSLEHGGVLVTGVVGGGPASRAGLKPGDIITRINGGNVYNPQQAIEVISGFKPGEEITLDVLRGWDDLTVTATVSQRPSYPN